MEELVGTKDARKAGETTSLSMTDEIFTRIRSDIIHGILRPNEPLVEAELAERYGVSRTPVRESLLRLASDGLIESRRRRWLVHEHTFSEIVEIYHIRVANEGYAARLAAVRADPDSFGALREMRLELTRAHPSVNDRIAVSDKFHSVIMEAAGNGRLTRVLKWNQIYAFNYALASFYTEESWAAITQRQMAIIDAILDQDPDKAELLVREHVEFSLHVISERGHGNGFRS